jgi:hypothetical protein
VDKSGLGGADYRATLGRRRSSPRGGGRHIEDLDISNAMIVQKYYCLTTARADIDAFFAIYCSICAMKFQFLSCIGTCGCDGKAMMASYYKE